MKMEMKSCVGGSDFQDESWKLLGGKPGRNLGSLGSLGSLLIDQASKNHSVRQMFLSNINPLNSSFSWRMITFTRLLLFENSIQCLLIGLTSITPLNSSQIYPHLSKSSILPSPVCFQLIEFNLCCLYTHWCGAIPEKMVALLGTTPVKKIDSPSPRDHHLSITHQLWVRAMSSSPLQAGMLIGLIWSNLVGAATADVFMPCPKDTVLLQSFGQLTFIRFKPQPSVELVALSSLLSQNCFHCWEIQIGAVQQGMNSLSTGTTFFFLMKQFPQVHS